MNTTVKLPIYVRVSLVLLGLYILIDILYIAQGIILPVIYATIIAIAISPAVNYLVKKNINRALSISIILALTFLIIIGLILLVSSQASLLSDAWPRLVQKFQELFKSGILWVSGYFDISQIKIKLWVADAKADLLSNSNSVIGVTIFSVGAVLATAFLTPVYVFMLLLYQPHLIDFTHKVFDRRNDNNVGEILSETKKIVQSYLLGLFAEFAIVAVLNALGLLLLGIDYAILLGIIGALLNVIPYIGGVIGVALFMAIALVTKPAIFALYVVLLYTVIQFVDNNYIVPRVVGSKVKLNALVSLMAVIAGAALWGMPGMFLSIPITGILKLVLDRIDSLKPWGFLLGDTLPPLLKIKPVFKKRKD